MYYEGSLRFIETNFIRFCIFVGIFSLIAWKSQYGINFTDEGFYISSAYRFFRGDGTDFLATLRHVDLLNVGIFYVVPDIGLYGLRVVGGLFQAFSCTVLYSYLRNRTNLTVALSGALLMALWNIYLGIWSPGYNLYASTLLTASVLTLADTQVERASLWASLKIFWCGIALGVVIVAYGTLLPLVAVVLCCYAWHFQRVAKGTGPLISLFSGTVTSLTVYGMLLLYSTGWNEWSTNVWIHSTAYSKISRLEVVTNLAKGIFEFHYYSRLIAIISIVAIAGCVFFRKHMQLILFLSVNSMLLISLITTEYWVSTDRFYYGTIFLVSLLIPQIILYFIYTHPTDFSTMFPFAIGIFAWIIFFISTFYFTPARSFMAGFQAFPLLVAGMLPAIARINSETMKSHSFTSRHLIRIGTGIGIVYLLLGLKLGIQYFRETIYRDAELSKLTTEFKHHRLHHIFSSPERVVVIEALTRAISEITDKGDYLLAYDEAPLLHFLLGMKSFTPTVWMSNFHGREYNHRLLSDGIAHNRIPKLAIRCLVDLDEPDWNTAPPLDYSQSIVDEYVKANYQLIKTLFPFEIWERKQSNPL